MTELESEAMEAEFDTVAGWTEEAVRALGPETAIPAGCRGSGSEGALRWLAEAAGAGVRTATPARLRRGSGRTRRVAGRGVGARPVCAEPMVAAVRASPAAVRAALGRGDGAGSCLFADASFDAAVCLGVLCTTLDKAGGLGELRRVLYRRRPAGACWCSSPTARSPPRPPEGNEFPSEADTRELLAAAGFEGGRGSPTPTSPTARRSGRVPARGDAEVRARTG